MSNKFEAFFKSYADAEEKLDVKLAHETVGEVVDVIPTGSLLLDEALSSGGIPMGRLIQLYGGPGSGKTLMTMLAMREAQKKDPSAYQVFIDAEGTFDPNWAETLGVDTTRVWLVEGDMAVRGQKCFEMLVGVPKEDAKTHFYAGKKKEGLLDKVAAGDLNVNLIVLDSIGAIMPPGEDTSQIGKMNMALLARFLTTTLRKLSLELMKANVPMIMINHKKSSMDMYGPDHSFSGGNAYTHFLSANIYFNVPVRKDAQIFNDNEERIGATINAKVEKSKFGPWPRTCEFKVKFTEGVVDRHEEVGQLAVEYGVVSKPSNVTYEYKDQKWVGQPKFFEGLKENPALCLELEEKIKQARLDKLQTAKLQQEALKEKKEESDEGDDADSNKGKKGKKGPSK